MFKTKDVFASQPHDARWGHLYRLWTEAMAQTGLPQFDRWISEEFRKNSKFGSRDRKWYSELLFAGVRHGYFAVFCDFLHQKTLADGSLLKRLQHHFDDTFAEISARFAAEFSTPEDILAAWKTLSPQVFFYWIHLRYVASLPENEIPQGLGSPSKALSPLSELMFTTLRARLENGPSLAACMLYSSVPLWFGEGLTERIRVSKWAEPTWRAFLSQQNSRPPLWLRLNHAERLADIQNELAKEDFTLEVFNTALKATGAKGIFATEAYRAGLFEIQDLASQAIGACVEARPGQLVWDCCAGGGGKTLQIASTLKNKGAVYASDVRTYKLDEVKKRAKRAGFFNIRCLPWDGGAIPEFQREVQNKGGFDWVLVDAPCTSTGTWRRNPDAKIRVDKRNIENLVALQSALLAKASKAVRPGGYLVYSTCSWLVEENEAIAEAFVHHNSAFTCVKTTLFGNPLDDADTMFAAVFKLA